ncbi:MAG: lamin tail domain-containing protein [Bacteroidota bacterium]
MRQIFIFLTLISNLVCFSQIQDDFSDGDFTSNPTWSGTDATFQINATTFQLQTLNTAGDTSYLSLPHLLTDIDSKEWHILAKHSFASSTSNFSRFYLTADNADLSTHPNGYFLQFGESGSNDTIRLFKREAGVSTQLCAGTTGQIPNSFTVSVKVTRSAAGLWSLFVDYTGNQNYNLQSSVTDLGTLVGTHSGMLAVYTLSNINKIFFDNVYIGPIIVDATPPSLVSATVIDASNVDVLFSESVEQVSAENLSNYSFSPSLGITSITRDASNLSLVHILTSSPLVNGTNYTLTVSNVNDLFSNTLLTGNLNVSLLVGEIPLKGDIIITEFFCDPSPKVGLAEIEFVEIYNKSSKIFHLQDWKLGDNSTSGTIADSWILPGEYKVLVTTSAIDSFPNSIAVSSFPSLNNAGDNIVLRDTSKLQVDSLTFDDTWYQDDIKAAGGYTIELINPNDPCSGKDNWKASNSLLGGTPGSQNSIFDATPDTQDPSMILLTAIAPKYLSIDFSEGMDSLSLVNAIASASPNLTVFDIFTANSPFPTNILVQFNENLVASQTYNFTISNVKDCWNNSANLSGIFALPEDALLGDLVINEILSDALTGGSDFIEIKNNSTKLIDLKDYELANFDNDTIAGNKKIEVNYILNPGDYVVITPDSTSQNQNYPATVSGKFIEMSLPTYSNDSGTVYLIKSNLVIDKVSYKSDWQFALLDDTDGKSLERIDSKGASNDKNNWHTASETIGFATPGRENSQVMYGEKEGVISLTNPIFSPDNDGFEDVLQINYSMIDAGKLATLTVYDDRGRIVKTLTKSELIGTEGTFTWDGVTEKNTKASIGTYVLLFEAFDLAGETFSKKIAFVLAGKI